MIRCLERDLKDIESILEPAKRSFQDLVQREMGFQFDLEIEIDKNRFLKPRELHDHSKDTVQGYDHIEDETVQKNEEDRKWYKDLVN